jgi:hypothetical protein
MGFLDKLRGKKDKVTNEVKEQATKTTTTTTNQQNSGAPSSGKRIKRYTSEGKPIYE